MYTLSIHITDALEFLFVFSYNKKIHLVLLPILLSFPSLVNVVLSHNSLLVALTPEDANKMQSMWACLHTLHNTVVSYSPLLSCLHDLRTTVYIHSLVFSILQLSIWSCLLFTRGYVLQHTLQFPTVPPHDDGALIFMLSFL